MELSRGEMAKLLFAETLKYIDKQRLYNNIIFKEVHLTDKLRVDLFWINWRDKITIFEVKSCRADFSNDSKWKNYLDYCHRFFFVCPEGVIEKEDLPKDIGLIHLTETSEGKYRLRVKRSPSELKPRKINNSWLRFLYRKLAFRKFVKLDGKAISLEEDTIFE